MLPARLQRKQQSITVQRKMTATWHGTDDPNLRLLLPNHWPGWKRSKKKELEKNFMKIVACLGQAGGCVAMVSWSFSSQRSENNRSYTPGHDPSTAHHPLNKLLDIMAGSRHDGMSLHPSLLNATITVERDKSKLITPRDLLLTGSRFCF